MSTNDGELAFPSDYLGAKGMSLRDYFAAKAMQSLLGDTERSWDPQKDDLVPDDEGTYWCSDARPFPWESKVVPYNPDGKEQITGPFRTKNTWRDRLAREAGLIADAMLAARERKGDEACAAAITAGKEGGGA